MNKQIQTIETFNPDEMRTQLKAERDAREADAAAVDVGNQALESSLVHVINVDVPLDHGMSVNVRIKS